MSTLNATILIRGETSTYWTTNNPVIPAKRLVCETDTGLVKLGTGANYNSTPYLTDWSKIQNKPIFKRSLPVFISGKPFADEIVWIDIVTSTTAFTIAASSTECAGYARTAATGTTTFTIKKNGTAVGTLVWSASGTAATVTVASPIVFAAGDIREIVAPSTPDATLANVAITLGGSV